MSISAEQEKLLGIYHEGLANYKTKDFAGAIAKFAACLEIDPDDGPSKLYLERCKKLKEDPPAQDWDGVFVMTTK